MAENDALLLVFTRNAFYKRLHYLVLGALILNFMLMTVLGTLLWYLVKHPTHPLYFPADNVSRLLKFVPVSNPNMTTEQVIQWTIDAVQAAYSFDYINYRAQLQNAQRYFTDYGWHNYMKALTASNNISGIASRRFVTNAQVIDKPQVLTEGMLAGAYAWRLKMPLLVSVYTPPNYDETSKFVQAWNVTVIVQRQNEQSGYKGLGIVQLIAAVSDTTYSAPSLITNSPSS